MFPKLTNPLFAIVGVTTFVLGLGAVFLYNHRNDRPETPQPSFEEQEITGFEQVTSAREGDLVTISGGIDIKFGFCRSYKLGMADICEAWFIGSSNENNFIPIRIKFCSESVRANCMSVFRTPIDFRDVYVLDNSGHVVDFDGEKLIEPPNTWTSESKSLTIMGRVSSVNGVGRFIEPIVRIEAEPKSK